MGSKELKLGALLSYGVIGLNLLVGVAYTPYLLRKLGQNEFGIYSLAASVLSYLTLFDLGFANAIVRYTSKYRAQGDIQSQKELFGMFAIIYSLLGFVILAIGYFFVDDLMIWLGNGLTVDELKKARLMIQILILNLALSFPFSIYTSIVTAYEKFIFQKSINILRILLNTVVMIAVLEMGYRAVGLVVVISIFNLLTLFSNFVFTRLKLKISFSFSRFNLKKFVEISKYSFYMFLNSIMDKIYWSSGHFILAAYSGASSVAIFAVAIQLQRLYMSFSQAISGVFLPKITQMVVQGKSNIEISNIFIKTGRIQYVVMSLILSGFVIFGKEFILLWAGEEYESVYFICLIIFSTLTVPLIQNVGITILQARNQLKFRSIIYLIISGISLCCQVYFSIKFGAIGAAIGIVIGLIIGQIIIMNIYYNVKQKLDILKYWAEIGKMSIVPIGLIILGLQLSNYFSITDWISFIFIVCFYTICFIVMTYLLSINNHEKSLINELLIVSIRKKWTL